MVKIRNFIRLIIIYIRHLYFTRIYGMNIASSARLSIKAKLDKTNPKGIHIGEFSYIAAGSYILSHDFSRNIHANTYIGKNCFVGINVIILPGLTIGDSVIIGSGAVVTKDIPSGCIAVGNPAKIIREGIKTSQYGQLL